MVTRCVCFDVSFTELKRLIDETGVQTLDDLRAHVQFGEKCQLCVPYAERIFKTGQTAFAIELED